MWGDSEQKAFVNLKTLIWLSFLDWTPGSHGHRVLADQNGQLVS